MRRIWLGILGAVVCLGLGLAVVGCDSATAGKNKMGSDKTDAGTMGGDKPDAGMMGGDKPDAGKMGGNKMGGEAKDKM